MARSLAKKGMKVTVLEWDRTARLPKEEWVDGVRRVRLKLKGSYGLHAFARLPLWLAYAGVHLLRNGYDFVQPQNFDNLTFSMFLRPFKRFRIVYDLADFYADAYLPNFGVVTWAVRHAERQAIESADGLIMVSEGQVLQVGSSHIPAAHTWIYNSPTDMELEAQQAQTRTEGQNEGLVVLYVGVLDNYHMPFLANFIVTAEQFDGISIRVAGYGENESFFNHTFRNTRYLGRLPHADVYRETRGCDLVLIPCGSDSINARIGLPNKLFDALSSSKPPIVERGTLMAKIAQENQCGISTEFNDPSDILLTLRTILSMRDELPAMGLRGKKLFDGKYRWAFAEGRLLGLYDHASRQILPRSKQSLNKAA